MVKSTIKTFIILLLLLCMAVFNNVAADDGKNEFESCQEIIYGFLYQDINNAVSAFYSQQLSEIIQLDTFSYKITDIKNIQGQTYQITVEVQPFVRAHNYIGKDRITFELTPNTKPRLISYKNIENKVDEYKEWRNRLNPNVTE